MTARDDGGARADRLAGLGLLLAGLAGPRLVTYGVPDAAVAALQSADVAVRSAGTDPGTDARTDAGPSNGMSTCMITGMDAGEDAGAGLLVVGRGTDLSAAIRTAGVPERAPVVVLRPPAFGRLPRGRALVARFGAIGPVDSPTHLVRLGAGGARAWFAEAVWQTWSPLARAGRLLARGPLLSRWGFPVEVLLLGPAGQDGAAKVRTGSEATDRADDTDGTAAVHPTQVGPALDGPAVIALGGGPTAGRSVLTYAVGGRPVRHVKIDIAERAAALEQELAGLRQLAGATGVPRPGRSARGPLWAAVEQSHLDGRMIALSWRPDDRDRWARDVDAVLGWLAEVTLPRGLVHGDLWPANVLVAHDRIGVIDWESAAPGDPLQDALSFLITAARAQQPDASLTDGAVAVLDADGWAAADTPGRLAPFLPSNDPGVCEERVLDRLDRLAQQCAPGGQPDANRQAAWSAVRDTVAAAWHRHGSPWRAGSAAPATAQPEGDVHRDDAGPRQPDTELTRMDQLAGDRRDRNPRAE